MVPLGVDKEKLLLQLERLQENILRLKNWEIKEKKRYIQQKKDSFKSVLRSV